MSMHYGISVDIEEYDEKKVKLIKEAAENEWQFSEWTTFEREGVTALRACYTEDNLCGGTSEEEFADILAQAVWRANGACCKVSVNATYLEELPCQTHVRNEEDYQRLNKPARNAQ